MKFEVQFDGRVVSLEDESLLPPAELEKFLDGVLSHLSRADNVKDATYRAVLEAGEVKFLVTVEGSEPADALVSGSSSIRSAFHAERAYTPGWSAHWCSVTVKGARGSDLLVDSVSAT